ncbi:MAG TPA: hypothetical protein VIV65_11320 [Gemmatimonadaceae bacterium]
MTDPGRPTDSERITELVRAYIGPRWESHYAAAWNSLGLLDGKPWGWSWNAAAGLLTIPWLGYRRRTLLGLAVGIVGGAVGTWIMYMAFAAGPAAVPFIIVAWIVAFSLVGDRIVLDRALKVARGADQRHGATQAAIDEVTAAGGVRAFLAVIYSIFGIVAFLFVIGSAFSVEESRYQAKQGRTVLMANLMALKDFEQKFNRDSGHYTATLDTFETSTGTINTVVVAATGWSAVASNPNWSKLRCAVAQGTKNPLVASIADGEIVCIDK